MTHHRQRSQLLLWLTGLTAVVILIAAFETTRILNGRTQDRVISDLLTQQKITEDRLIVDQLRCEVVALRAIVAAGHPDLDLTRIPRTTPRTSGLDEPCPPSAQ